MRASLLLTPLLVQQALSFAIEQLPLNAAITHDEGPQEIVDM